MTVHTIPKPAHGSTEWLNIRWADPTTGMRRISASAAAAVHAEHRYTTPADLASELLAPNPPTPKPTSPAMDRGNALEPALLAWAGEQLGETIVTPDELYVAGRLIATLDGIWGAPDAPDGVVEAKTSRDRWTGTLPSTWMWQGVQQAICADVDTIWWVILDGELDLHLFQQEVNTWEKQHHTQKCEEFLAAIDMGFAPPFVSFTYSHVTQQHPEPCEVSVDLPEQAASMIARLAAAKHKLAEAREQEDALKADVARMLGDAEVGKLDGRPVVSWRSQVRSGFDTKRFIAEHPELAREYHTTTSSRVLRLMKGNTK